MSPPRSNPPEREEAETIARALDARAWVSDVEHHVCWIEGSQGGSIGTGLLVADSVVLTNYHVLGKFQPGDYEKIKFVFPGEKRHDLKEILWRSEATEFESAKGAEVDPGSTPDQLDFVLAELTRPAGKDRLRPGEMRSWTPLPDPPVPAVPGNVLRVLGHPGGGPLRSDEGLVLTFIDGRRRLLHSVAVAGGSSGSPCFNFDQDLVALHNAKGGVGAFRGIDGWRAVPVEAIVEYLARVAPDLHSRVTQQPPAQSSRVSIASRAPNQKHEARAAREGTTPGEIEAHLRNGCLTKAVSAAAKLIRNDGPDPAVVRLHALALERQGLIQDAEVAIDRAIGTASRKVGGVGAVQDLLVVKADFMERSGRGRDAVDALDALRRLSAEDRDVGRGIENGLMRLRLDGQVPGLEPGSWRVQLQRLVDDPSKMTDVWARRPDLRLQFAAAFWSDDPDLLIRVYETVRSAPLDESGARHLAGALAAAETLVWQNTQGRARSETARAARWSVALQQAAGLPDSRPYDRIILHTPGVRRALAALIRRSALANRPYYRLIRGTVRLDRPGATGTRFAFTPTEMGDLDDFVGVERLDPDHGSVEVSLEGAIAPECTLGGRHQPRHEEALADLRERLRVGEDDRVQATLMVRTADGDGRLVAYLPIEEPPLGSGWRLVSPSDVEQTHNYQMVASGIAYPDLWTHMSWAHLAAFRDAANKAASGAVGIWGDVNPQRAGTTHDGSCAFRLHDATDIAVETAKGQPPATLIHPRLFRLCVAYLYECQAHPTWGMLEWFARKRAHRPGAFTIQAPEGRYRFTDMFDEESRNVRVHADRFDPKSSVFCDPASLRNLGGLEDEATGDG